MDKKYINDPGFEVPDNTIVVIPMHAESSGYYEEIIEPLKGKIKREWFNEHFYYCLPLNIGNQYGFLIKSLRDFDITWDGTEKDATITFLNNDNENKQIIKTGFTRGVITVQNYFSLKTPPGINLMTIQPPNLYIPACISMTGVVETDQIKRDFTFNFKVTVPNLVIKIRKGDPLGAFIPIPRYFVENFKIELAESIFDKEFLINENNESNALGIERDTVDKEKTHLSGRRYFSGTNSNGSKYRDHQKKIK